MREDELDEMTARMQAEADGEFNSRLIQEAVQEKDRELAALRSLLAKYIEHVDQAEGSNFLGPYHRGDSDVEFTDEEWAQLSRMAGHEA